MYRVYVAYLLLGFLFLFCVHLIESMEEQDKKNLDIKIMEKDLTYEDSKNLCLIIKKTPKIGFDKLQRLSKNTLSTHLENKQLLKTLIEYYNESGKDYSKLMHDIFEANLILNNKNIFKGYTLNYISSMIEMNVKKKNKTKLLKIIENLKTSTDKISDEDKYEEDPCEKEFWEAFWQDMQYELYVFITKKPSWAQKIHQESGMTTLHAVIRNFIDNDRNHKLIRLLTTFVPNNLFKEDKNGNTPIDHANSFTELHGTIKNNISLGLGNVCPDDEVLNIFDTASTDKNFKSMYNLILKNPEIMKWRDLYCYLREEKIDYVQQDQKEKLQNIKEEEIEWDEKKSQEIARQLIIKTIIMIDPHQSEVKCEQKIKRLTRKKLSFDEIIISRSNEEKIIKDMKTLKKTATLYDLGKRFSIFFAKKNNSTKNDVKKQN